MSDFLKSNLVLYESKKQAVLRVLKMNWKGDGSKYSFPRLRY
jgi:hypothetical protein